jgi:hypothetical protein
MINEEQEKYLSLRKFKSVVKFFFFFLEHNLHVSNEQKYSQLFGRKRALISFVLFTILYEYNVYVVS